MNVLDTLDMLFHSKTFTLGFSIVVTVSLIALLADIIAPYPPLDFVGNVLEAPSWKHLFGTDDLGRDIFSMVVYGSRVSLIVGFLAAIFSTIIGTAIGITCGILRGIIDAITMRFIDFMLSLPYLALALAILAFLKPNIFLVVLVIVILGWVSTAKVVRAQTLTIMASPFVEAARAIGASNLHIALRHVLPNAFPVILSSLVLSVRSAILFEATLSFLGLGDPALVSWGTILFFARRAGAFILGAWWYIIPPGFMIMITVLGFTLMAIGLDEVLNPRLRR